MENNMRTIVIVGGGAGGMELATRLGDSMGKKRAAKVILVDQSPTHFWKPLLHEVAAGKTDPHVHQVEYRAHATEHHFEFVCGTLTGLDRLNKKIEIGPPRRMETEKSSTTTLVSYDALVLAFGSVTNFFGVPGAAEHCVTLDTVRQAESFRQSMIATIMRENSSRESSGTRKGIDIVIVGGGATGVELAAELRNTAIMLAHYNVHDMDPMQDIRIKIVEAGERILPQLKPHLSARTTSLLKTLNVGVATGKRVSEVAASSVKTGDGESLHADIAVWAAGISAPLICTTLGLPVNRIGQIMVGATLQSELDPDIFAIGDCASAPWKEQDARLPPRAQVAHQQAMHLTKVFRKNARSDKLPEFVYRDYGSLVSLGRFSAVGALVGGIAGKGVFVEGLIAKFLYSSLYRKHVLALHGAKRMVFDTMMLWLRARISPQVKLH
jgi:NADH dehydrogenase